jgi:NADH-quinone oxidoreductase subunit N
MHLLIPELTLISGSILCLMLDILFLHKKPYAQKFITYLAITFIACAIFFLFKNINIGSNQLILNELLRVSTFTTFIKIIFLVLLLLLISSSYFQIKILKQNYSEFLFLLMISAAGAMFLVSSIDLLSFYVSLELQTIPLYIVAALDRKSDKSSEAGLKYFILGVSASCILLFGISMTYGFSGQTFLYKIFSSKISLGTLFGLLLILVALFFKISAAPFHMWSPDVYEGSSITATSFFASISKLSFLVIFSFYFIQSSIIWSGMEKIIYFIAIISFFIGAFGAIKQTNLKRLLAYSSIGHVGFMLAALSAKNTIGIQSFYFYAIVYAFLSIAAFSFLMLMDQEDKYNISNLSGLAKANPILAFLFSALMLSFAGIPPMLGFFSKFYVLKAVVIEADNQNFILPILMVIYSAIAAFYYLRIIKVIYFDKAEVDNKITLENKAGMLVFVILSLLTTVAIFFVDPMLMILINSF